MPKRDTELPPEHRCYLLYLLGDNSEYATIRKIPPALEALRDRLESGQRLDTKGPLRLTIERAGKRPIGDFVAVVDGGDVFPSLIVSRRLRDLFKKHCAELEAISVILLDKTGSPLRDEFALVNPLRTVDVLDELANKAHIRFHATTAVIDPQKVASAPQLFRFAQGEYSDRYGIRYALAHAIKELDLPNVSWSRLAGPTIDGQLLGAARAGDLAVVKRLLANGASANGLKGSDDKPLLEAADAGHVAVCRALIAAGAKIDGQDSDKTTALTRAVGNPELLRYLLDAGADPNLGDALSVCEDPIAITTLLDAGAKLSKGTFVATSIRTLLDPSEQAQHATVAACLRAALPKAGKLRSRIEQALSASTGDATAVATFRQGMPSMLDFAAAAGTRAAKSTVLSFDKEQSITAQIEEWTDNAWYSDGVAALEADYSHEGDAIHGEAAMTAYSQAFVDALMARPAVERLMASKASKPKSKASRAKARR